VKVLLLFRLFWQDIGDRIRPPPPPPPCRAIIMQQLSLASLLFAIHSIISIAALGPKKPSRK